MKKITLILSICLVCFGCATFHTYYKTGTNQIELLGKKEVAHTFFLVGDAGNVNRNDIHFNLDYFRKTIQSANKNSTVLFLGDNIYPKGLPEKNAKGRGDAEESLLKQINLVDDFKGNTIFIPGNHDWYSSGVKGLKREENFVEKRLGKDSFLPENGCPIEKVNISDEIVLIIIDSQWYFTNWDKHPTINDDCEIKTRNRFFEEVESEIKKARGKTTLIAIHHPMFTNGPHGGNFSFGSHLTPAPILGTLKNLIRKTSGVSPQDIQNRQYNEFRKQLITLAQQNTKTIFLSGHEHNLQYLVQDNIHQIVSGSGSKLSPTKSKKGTLFSASTPGFAKLTVYKDGSSSVAFISCKTNETLYQAMVFEKDTIINQNTNSEFPDYIKASVYDAEKTSKSSFHKLIWGERYRKYYGIPVLAKTVNLDTLYGGLKPVRKGGGHQSKSLRLETQTGAQYVMRAIEKQAIQYLQTTVFRDQYVEKKFEDTRIESVVLDVFTGAHPFAPMVIGELADAVGVYHTNPKLFYVPKQKALKAFNVDFGDELYLLEEHTSEGHSDQASFGYAENLISTYDVLKEIHKDEDIILDEKAYIRARLFDMLIGDWDRHQDQWRWIEFDAQGKIIYRPMPRDRDQAFSKMSDGFLLSTAVTLSPQVRLLRQYEEDLKDIKGFNLEAFPLDKALIQQASLQDWEDQARIIEKGITNAVINNAFKNMPEEVQDKTVEDIKTKLKSRLKNLTQIAQRYSNVLSKFEIVTGTNKDDAFIIDCNDDGRVSVQVYRIKGRDFKDLFLNKTYHPNETKELWIYGLDDDDTFKVQGKSKKIKIRLIGGQNNDTYKVEHGKNIVIYDNKTKKNTLTEGEKARVKLSDDYKINVFDFRKPRNNTNQILPGIGANPDDGLKIGITDTYTTYGFNRNPFTTKHILKAQYFLATKGFDFGYNGEFAKIMNKWNLNLDVRFTSENYAENFFGYGNSSPNFESDPNDGLNVNLDYNRVKQHIFHVLPTLKWIGYNQAKFNLGIGYESIEVQRTPGRFLETYFNPHHSVFGTQKFLLAFASYHYENQNNASFPTLGMQFGLDLSYKRNLLDQGNLTKLTPMLAFDYNLFDEDRWVLATKLKANVIFGNKFEFYQAATLGAKDGLRGFRNQRFSGRHSFYQNIDLRYSFKTVKTSFLPLNFGIYTGFDYGRVWVSDNLVNNAAYNKDIWNTSYGGGFWLSAVDVLSARFGLFNSKDSLRLSFGLGMDF